MWDLHRNVDRTLVPPGRTVISFRFPDLPAQAAVLVAGDDPRGDRRLRLRPGHEVAGGVTGRLRDLVLVWRGDLELVRGRCVPGRCRLTVRRRCAGRSRSGSRRRRSPSCRGPEPVAPPEQLPSKTVAKRRVRASFHVVCRHFRRGWEHNSAPRRVTGEYGQPHEGGRPQRGQEPRVPGGDHPVRGARVHPARPRGGGPGRAPGSGSSITDDEFVAAGAKIADDHDQVWGEAEMILKVKEPIADRVRADAAGPDPVHLPAPGRQPGVHPGPARPAGHRDRLRDGAAARRRAAAAGPDERGRRPAGAAGRRVPPDGARAAAGAP